MRVGVQFTGTVGANRSSRWFTHSWPPSKHVVWTVVPTSPRSGAPQIEWEVQVQRESSTKVTYFITIKNLTSSNVDIEARYAFLN